MIAKMKGTTIKYLFQKAFIMALGLIMSVAACAQGPCDPGGGPGVPDNECPIDSWVYVLIAAVVLIAVKKAYDAKKANVISL